MSGSMRGKGSYEIEKTGKIKEFYPEVVVAFNEYFILKKD